MSDAIPTRAAKPGTRVEFVFQAIQSLSIPEAERIQRAMYAAAVTEEALIAKERASA